jgi:hypothetical protein
LSEYDGSLTDRKCFVDTNLSPKHYTILYVYGTRYTHLCCDQAVLSDARTVETDGVDAVQRLVAIVAFHFALAGKFERLGKIEDEQGEQRGFFDRIKAMFKDS